MTADKTIKLKVVEAVLDDVNKGIVRIDSNFMQQIAVKPGDIGRAIIRMDGLMRRNSKTGIGEVVEVKKTEVVEAEKIVIAPATHKFKIRAPPSVFKRGLLGRVVVKGDLVSLGGASRRKITMSDNPFFDEVF